MNTINGKSTVAYAKRQIRELIHMQAELEKSVMEYYDVVKSGEISAKELLDKVTHLVETKLFYAGHQAWDALACIDHIQQSELEILLDAVYNTACEYAEESIKHRGNLNWTEECHKIIDKMLDAHPEFPNALSEHLQYNPEGDNIYNDTLWDIARYAILDTADDTKMSKEDRMKIEIPTSDPWQTML